MAVQPSVDGTFSLLPYTSQPTVAEISTAVISDAVLCDTVIPAIGYWYYSDRTANMAGYCGANAKPDGPADCLCAWYTLTMALNAPLNLSTVYHTRITRVDELGASHAVRPVRPWSNHFSLRVICPIPPKNWLKLFDQNGWFPLSSGRTFTPMHSMFRR